MLQKHHGFFLADVVGLGKTIVAVLIAKKFFYHNGFPGHLSRVLVVAPPALLDGWQRTLDKFDMQYVELHSSGSLHKIRQPDRFDLVVVPGHDRLRGPNVVTTLGALNRVTPERLAVEGAAWAPRLAHLPSPRVAVLIGGDNGVYRLTAERMRRLADDLAALSRAGFGLMVTPSRRTGPVNEAILGAALDAVRADVWDGTGDNPYFGYLALADAIIVTADSVNMVTEAGATGRPVHVVDLEGGSSKFAAFHAAMREAGITRPFEGRIAQWDYPPLLETARVAGIVRDRLRARA
jgi:mitochondrial fission protein ELM1